MTIAKFVEGLSARMGAIYKPNRALSSELLKAFFRETENRAQSQEDLKGYHDWIVFYTYFLLSYVLSLRGSEGFLLDLKTLIEEWSDQEKGYVVVPLLGKLKGESKDSFHRLPCADITSSGLKVRATLENLIVTKCHFRQFDGPAISDITGQVLTSNTVNEFFHDILINLFHSQRDLFPFSIKDEENIKMEYQSFGSFRRSSDTQALNGGVPQMDITIVNRWSLSNLKGKKKSSTDMI